jgi:hypothetical protein
MLPVVKFIINPMNLHFVRNCLQEVRTCHPKLESIRAATADLVSFLCIYHFIGLFTSVMKLAVSTVSSLYILPSILTRFSCAD